jgi:hypothetical protein
MKKYEPKAVRDYYTEGAWTAIQGIANTLKGKSGTSASVLLKTLNSDKLVNYGPLVAKQNTSVAGPVPGSPRIFDPYVAFFKIKNGQFVSDGPFINAYQ